MALAATGGGGWRVQRFWPHPELAELHVNELLVKDGGGGEVGGNVANKGGLQGGRSEAFAAHALQQHQE